MSSITIQAQDLMMALENHNYEIHYFLDLETGEVTFYTDDMEESEEYDQIETNPDRFLAIEPFPSRDNFQIMADFTDTVENPKIRRQLEYALENRRPFRGFKDALENYPQLREQWFRYKEEEMIFLAKDWLKINNVEATIEPFYKDE